MRYLKDTPDTIYFRYCYDDESRQLRVNLGVSGRPSNPPGALESLFNEPPAITEAKYQDILFLCNSLAIPRFYHDFYRVSNSSLAEPDATEDEIGE